MPRLLRIAITALTLLAATGLQARDHHREHRFDDRFEQRPAYSQARQRNATAAERRRQAWPGRMAEQKAERSLSEAIAIARSRVPGELVSASRSADRNGEPVYHIRILTRKGVVRTVRVPASAR